DSDARRYGRGCRVRDDLGHADLVGSLLALVVARNGHQSDDLASVHQRNEESRREMLVPAAIRRLFIARVVDRYRALLANSPAPRRVLWECRVGMELLDRAVRSNGEAIGEVGLRCEG